MSEDRQSELQNLLGEFPRLKALHDWAVERAISIEVEPAAIASDGYDPRLLTISSPNKSPIRFVAFDEYIEARSDNIMLSLILLENDVDEINYGEDLKYWAGVNFLDAENAIVKQVYTDNLKARDALFEAYGIIPDARFNWELEMGIDAGGVLRALNVSVASKREL
jgi:hypothetical protein